MRILADCSEEEENILTTVYEGLVAINHFMSSVYNQPLIVQPADSGKNAEYGLLFMRAFNGAALDALGLRRPRFKVMPKFHLYAHIVHSMRLASERGEESLNILAFSCQVDEDYVGKVAGQSRNVSIRKVHARTIQRYCLNLALRW